MQNNNNKKTDPTEYKIGDKVYLFKPAVKQGTSSKLFKKWHGPFRILDLTGVNATIKEVFGRK